MAITKDIVADYGADNTGVADVGPEFYTDFKADAAGQDATLTVPAGTYNFNSRPGGFFWAEGMTSLVVNATGSTWTSAGASGPILGSSHMAQAGINAVGGKSARLRTVSAGATQVRLTAQSASDGHISRAVVGSWMCIASFDIQGLFLSAYGWPPNAHFIDFVQITSVGADTIDFTPALRYTHSDQYPMLNAGSAFEGDSGGPATAYFLSPNWGNIKVFNGGTYDNTNLIHCEGLDFTMNGGVSSNLPIYPSVNKIWRANNHVISSGALMEVDKFVDEVYVDGGTYAQWHNQSSSVRYTSLKNASFTSINGTGKETVVDTCVVSGGINIGPTSQGTGETFICRDTSIGGGIAGGISSQGPSDLGVQQYQCTMTNGVLKIPLSSGTGFMTIFPPDPAGRNVVFWTSEGRSVSSFQVKSVTADSWPAADNQSSTPNVTITNGSNILQVSTSIFQASDVGKVIIVDSGRSSTLQMRSVITQFDNAGQVRIAENFTNSLSAVAKTVQWGTFNAYIQTSEPGGFPSTIPAGTTKIGFRVPPARMVYFENCTGTEQAVDLSQAAARNRPLNSYTKRQYSSLPTASSTGLRLSAAGALAGTGSVVPMFGFIQSIKFNVTKAYTGAQGTLNAGLGQFFVNLYIAGVQNQYNPRINVKVVGERVITPSGVTGAQTGDQNLSFGSVPAWIDAGFSPVLSANINAESASVWPEFTIEMITDQGFSTGPIAVAPLRLRLRAL